MEVMVASGISGLLVLALFFIFRMCSSAWMKGDTQTRLRQNCMVASEKLSRDIERSVYDSLSISADRRGVSFLTALDANGEFQFNTATTEPIWQAYCVYYYDAPSREFRKRTISVAGSPQADVPAPIENFGPNQPIENYMNGGTPVSRELDSCELTLSGQLLRLKLSAQAKRYGSERLETFELESVTSLRN